MSKKCEQEKRPSYSQYPKSVRPKPITKNHRTYHNLCRDDLIKILLCKGFAGTGKSIVAAYYASQYLYEGKVSSIVLARSLEGLGKDPGAYPGSPFEKNEPKLRQLIKYITLFTGRTLESLFANEQLEVQGLYDMQGADFTDKFLIVTEGQTLTAEEMYCVVTRGASKTIIEGDTASCQLTNHAIDYGDDGISFLLETIGDLPFVGTVEMTEDDCVRTGWMKDILVRMMPALEERRIH